MNEFIVALAKKLLLARGLRVTRATDPLVLERFMASAWPKETDKKLIREGGHGDGGYLIPDDLAAVGALFSPGVAEEATFELSLAERGIKCFLADFSVEGPPLHHGNFDFEKKFLGATGGGEFITLDDWVARKAPGGSDLMLQMDIEGSEYEVLYAASRKVLSRFRIIVVEFHHLSQLVEISGFSRIERVFRKLLELFVVVHIHPNNWRAPIFYDRFAIPPIMEFTFLRKDRVRWARPAVCFPHELDRTCVPDKVDVKLPLCWYKGDSGAEK